MAHLYELSEQYRNLVATLSDSDTEEITEQSIKDRLQNITEQLNTKVESIGKLILELSSDSDVMQKEIDRLSNRKRIADNKIIWLKTYVLQEMLSSGIKKISGEVVTLTLRDAPVSVNILNKDEVEEKFRRIVPETWDVNKQLIVSNFKETGEVPKGCEMITTRKTLMIK